MLALPFRFGWWETNQDFSPEERKAYVKKERKRLSRIVLQLSHNYPWQQTGTSKCDKSKTIVPVVMPDFDKAEECRIWLGQTMPPACSFLGVVSVQEWWGAWPKYIPSVTKAAYVCTIPDLLRGEESKGEFNNYGEPSTDLPLLLFPCISKEEAHQCIWLFLAFLSHTGQWNEPGYPHLQTLAMHLDDVSCFHKLWGQLPDHWSLKLASCEQTSTVCIEGSNGWQLQASKTLCSFLEPPSIKG